MRSCPGWWYWTGSIGSRHRPSLRPVSSIEVRPPATTPSESKKHYSHVCRFMSRAVSRQLHQRSAIASAKTVAMWIDSLIHKILSFPALRMNGCWLLVGCFSNHSASRVGGVKDLSWWWSVCNARLPRRWQKSAVNVLNSAVWHCQQRLSDRENQIHIICYDSNDSDKICPPK